MSFSVLMLILAGVLLVEGIGPLLFPAKWQQYLQQISNMDQNVIRRLGGALVTAGAVLMILFIRN